MAAALPRVVWTGQSCERMLLGEMPLGICEVEVVVKAETGLVADVATLRNEAVGSILCMVELRIWKFYELSLYLVNCDPVTYKL